MDAAAAEIKQRLRAGYDKRSVVQLRNSCRQRGISQEGRKRELIERLVDKDTQAMAPHTSRIITQVCRFHSSSIPCFAI